VRRWAATLAQLGEWTTAGEPTEGWVAVDGEVELQNHWGLFSNAMRHHRVLSVDALRGGPAMTRPGIWMLYTSLHSDRRRALSATLDLFVRAEDENAARSGYVWPQLRVRGGSRTDVTFGPELDWSRTESQYVTTLALKGRPEYVVGRLSRRTAALTTRLTHAFTPDLSLQLYAQPYLSAGHYGRLARVADSRAKSLAQRLDPLDGARIAPGATEGTLAADVDGDGTRESTIADPDFNFAQLNSNLVLRWQYRPGSTLHVVWGSGRTRAGDDGRLRLGDDVRALLDSRGTNVLLVKLAYRFSAAGER
jgi:hypothetical protein